MTRPHAAAPRRTRGSWTPRIVGIGAAVLVACGAAIVYAIASPAGAARHAEQLSSRVSTVQTVGIIGQAGGALGSASAMRMLSAQGGSLLFAPVPASVQPQGDPQWTVDTMADGTYIFIYAPTGSCLAAAGRPRPARLALRRCDLGPEQRWHQAGGTLEASSHQYAQYRNVGNGRCLATAGGATGSDVPAPPALVACAPAAAARQLISFFWGVAAGD
jgi:Ricin-type beta-trefoil lectin domain-like